MSVADTFVKLRASLEGGFSGDTAQGEWDPRKPSTGHCAVVALIVRELHGGDVVSTSAPGQSHWFNRAYGLDIDLTADQFGHDPVMVRHVGSLWPDARVRGLSDATAETWQRALRLALRSGVLL